MIAGFIALCTVAATVWAFFVNPTAGYRFTAINSDPSNKIPALNVWEFEVVNPRLTSVDEIALQLYIDEDIPPNATAPTGISIACDGAKAVYIPHPGGHGTDVIITPLGGPSLGALHSYNICFISEISKSAPIKSAQLTFAGENGLDAFISLPRAKGIGLISHIKIFAIAVLVSAILNVIIAGISYLRGRVFVNNVENAAKKEFSRFDKKIREQEKMINDLKDQLDVNREVAKFPGLERQTKKKRKNGDNPSPG